MQSTQPIHLSAIRYQTGEFHEIEKLPELQAQPDLLANFHALGLEECAIADRPISELTREALAATLSASPLDPSEIPLIVVASDSFGASTLRAGLPSTIADLGMTRAVMVGVTLADCGNLHAALRITRSLMVSEGLHDAIVLTADAHGDHDVDSRIVRPRISVFSDAATACRLSLDEGDFVLRSTKQFSDPGAAKIDAYANPIDFLEATIQGVQTVCDDVLSACGLERADIDHLVTNNYNLSVSALFAERGDFPLEKVHRDNIPRIAHAYASDNLINLKDLDTETPLEPGQRALLIGTGPFTWGASLVEKCP